VPPQPGSSGDALPQQSQVIEIRVAELRQLFNAIDPSPFRQRDLDPRAEEFIVGWASDLQGDRPWALVVHLDRPAGRADEAVALREAIHEYFGQRVVASKRKLRELFRRGRISLVIALAFLTASIAVGDAVAVYLGDGRLGEVIREGFLIGGWVAMWRPLEVFLYDWWPIRADGHLLQRLSTMPVRIEYKETAPADAWHSDWPEVAAAEVPRGAPIAIPLRTRSGQWNQKTGGINTRQRKNAEFARPRSTRRLRIRSRRVILLRLIPILTIIPSSSVSFRTTMRRRATRCRGLLDVGSSVRLSWWIARTRKVSHGHVHRRSVGQHIYDRSCDSEQNWF
jgi:hypothetical protein